jgi:hypothetical protein
LFFFGAFETDRVKFDTGKNSTKRIPPAHIFNMKRAAADADDSHSLHTAKVVIMDKESVSESKFLPAMPPKVHVAAQLEAWKIYAKELRALIEQVESDEREVGIAAEILEYESEGKVARLARCCATDGKTWVFEAAAPDTPIAAYAIKCCAEYCWFERNLDRVDEYSGSHRLAGTTDAYLCDICFGQGAHLNPSEELAEKMFATLREERVTNNNSNDDEDVAEEDEEEGEEQRST